MAHGGYLEWGTVNSLIDTLRGDAADRQIIEFVQEEGVFVAASRQKMALKFVEEDQGEWLFFVDSDIIWKLDDVYALLDSADPIAAPIVAGCVFLNGPHGIQPAGWQEGEKGINWLRGGMVEAFVVGTGFACYHIAALQAVQERFGTMFAEAWEGQRFFGEDVAFSYRAREAGLKLYMNCDVRPTHVKKVGLDEGWARASLYLRETSTTEEE